MHDLQRLWLVSRQHTVLCSKPWASPRAAAYQPVWALAALYYTACAALARARLATDSSVATLTLPPLPAALLQIATALAVEREGGTTVVEALQYAPMDTSGPLVTVPTSYKA
jgi:hypothetical protein